MFYTVAITRADRNGQAAVGYCNDARCLRASQPPPREYGRRSSAKSLHRWRRVAGLPHRGGLIDTGIVPVHASRTCSERLSVRLSVSLYSREFGGSLRAESTPHKAACKGPPSGIRSNPSSDSKGQSMERTDELTQKLRDHHQPRCIAPLLDPRLIDIDSSKPLPSDSFAGQ